MSDAIKEVTCLQALATLGDHNSILADVRCPEEYSLYGQILGAHLVPWKLIRDDALVDNPYFLHELKNVLNNSKGRSEVYFICGSGNRSREVAEYVLHSMKNDGYEVYSVAGGISAWVCSGLPISAVAP